MNQKPVYSVVAPIYNESKSIPEFYERIRKTMDSLGEPWELVLVNDGSRDNSLDMIRDLNAKDPRVKVIDFARNFGHQIAVTAGMDHTHGDAVIVIDSDLQDPPEVIANLAEQWKQGYEVVYAVRNKRPGETWFKLFTAKLFYRMIYRITDVNIPLDTGDFRLMDRRVVNAVNGMREHNRFIRGMTSWVGFRQTGVLYDREVRKFGTTNYPLRKMVKLAWDAITGFSYYPLQLAMYASLILFVLSVLGIPVVTFLRLATGHQWFAGQATAIVVVLLLGSFQFFFFFVMGQYMARIYDEVRGRPLYIIADTFGLSDEKHRRAPGSGQNIEERAKVAPTSEPVQQPISGAGVLPSEGTASD
ncbi:MAG: glycosyltransferase family 2 protein [Anaerolineae bacterium]|nr:glycosyltransferase family 2 protein [Anaerolineae bacterium]